MVIGKPVSRYVTDSIRYDIIKIITDPTYFTIKNDIWKLGVNLIKEPVNISLNGVR